MDVPVSVMLLIVVVIATVASVAYYYYTHWDKPSTPPVSFTLEGGQLVYKIGNTYIINLHMAKQAESPPIGICKLGIVYQDASGNIKTDTITFATGPKTYRKTGTFSGGTVEFDETVITTQTEQKLAIVMNDANSKPINLVLYLCVYGEPPRPKWSEAISIPNTPLTP